MEKKRLAKINIPIIYLKEGNSFVCYTPAFDLAAHGDSFADAERSFAESIGLVVEEISKRGNWSEVFEEYGWGKLGRRWLPPRVIGQASREVSLPIGV